MGVVSVGVEADLDAVRIVQTDQHGSPAVTGDHTAVHLSARVEVLHPRLNVVAGRYRQGHRIEAGQGGGTVGIESQRQPQGWFRSDMASPRSSPSSVNSISTWKPRIRWYQSLLADRSLTGSFT